MVNINLNPFPILTTGHLVLRKLHIGDSEQIFQLRSDASVNKYIDRDRALTVEDAKSFINKIEHTLINRRGVYWAITAKADNVLIGTIGYWNFNLENNTAEIGYELLPDHHRRGLMQQAIEKVLAYGFEVMGLEGIVAFPREDNISSIRLLERNGFKPNLKEDNYLRFYLKK